MSSYFVKIFYIDSISSLLYHDGMTIQQLILKIRSTGLTDAAIAQLISTDSDAVNQTVVCAWKNGVNRTTTWERYDRVRELYKKLKRKHKI